MSQHTPSADETEVLVVGAGPIGMVLASELKRHGMPCRIIDRLPQLSHTSKALGIQARTLELFEKMEVVERFLAEGVQLGTMNIYGRHHQIAQIRMQEVPSRYPFLLALPQWETEQILTAHLEQQAIEVERGVALTALQQTGTGVDAVLEHPDGQSEQVHTRWLIGCDGPHSTVRGLLGLQFEGFTFEQTFALADVHMDYPLPADQAAVFWREGDFIGCLPMPQGQHRLIIGYRPQTGPEGDVTLEELRRALDKCGWTHVRITDAVWSSRFHVNQRKVRHYRQDAVFLAGDACHIHSPMMGQGMNAGIQDAFNLAWKLALVSREEAHPSVLESYEAERERFGRQLLRGTDLFSQLALLQGPLSSRLRDWVTPLVAHITPVRKGIETHISQLDVSYRRSPIVREHQVGQRFEPPDLQLWGRQVRHAGERAPDMPVRLGTTPTCLHTLCLGTRHVLFCFAHRQDPERSQPAWQELETGLRREYGHLVDAFLILPHGPGQYVRPDTIYDENARLSTVYGLPEDGLVLVRPDGYIAFLSRPVSLEQFWAYLASVLRAQTRPASTATRSEIGSRS